MPHTDEVDHGILVVRPAEIVDIRVETLGDVAFRSGGQVVETQALAVALIAIAGHAQPSHILAVGRELRVLVVSRVVGQVLGRVHLLCAEGLGGIHLRCYVSLRLAKVAGGAVGDVVEVDVGVGGNGVFESGLLAAGIGNLLGVAAPVDLLDAAKRLHGAFEGFALQNVGGGANTVGSDLGHEGMGDALHIMVPVAVHQVGHQAAGGLGQVGGILLDNLMEGQLLDINHAVAVGREFVAFHIAVGVAQLATVAAVGLHRPDLTTGDEGDARAQPRGVGLVVGAGGELALAGAVGIDDAEHMVALVLLHAIVAHLVDNLLAVGRGCISADAAHGPQPLGGEQVALQRDVAFSYIHFLLCFHGAAACQGKCCHEDE